jgi:hypothetical protein
MKTAAPQYITYLSDDQLDRLNSALGITLDTNVGHQDGKGQSITRKTRLLMVTIGAVIIMGIIAILI